MYNQVSNKLFLPASGTLYSQAVSMAGANALQVEYTLFRNTSTGTLHLYIEEGNDLENWKDTLGTTPAASGTLATAEKYDTFKVTGIAAQYVRLKYVTDAGGAFVIGAGINTAQL